MCPSHHVHDSASLILAGTLLYIGTRQEHLTNGVLLSLSALGAISNLALSPDLDGSRSMSLIRWKHANILIALWWKGYDKIARHRGRSHIPVIGTLSRLLWLSIPFALILAWLSISGLTLDNDARGTLWTIMQAVSIPFLCWLSGLILADSLHAAMDWADSRIKRMVREWKAEDKITS